MRSRVYPPPQIQPPPRFGRATPKLEQPLPRYFCFDTIPKPEGTDAGSFDVWSSNYLTAYLAVGALQILIDAKLSYVVCVASVCMRPFKTANESAPHHLSMSCSPAINSAPLDTQFFRCNEGSRISSMTKPEKVRLATSLRETTLASGRQQCPRLLREEQISPRTKDMEPAGHRGKQEMPPHQYLHGLPPYPAGWEIGLQAVLPLLPSLGEGVLINYVRLMRPNYDGESALRCMYRGGQRLFDQGLVEGVSCVPPREGDDTIVVGLRYERHTPSFFYLLFIKMNTIIQTWTRIPRG